MEESHGTHANAAPSAQAGRPTQAAHNIPAADPNLVLDCYRKDEWGDALLFAHLFEGQCVYDHMEKSWYLWQGHYWKRDEIGRVRQLVSGLLASVYLNAAADLNARMDEQPSRRWRTARIRCRARSTRSSSSSKE